jgi:K+-transporting ATPase ATPase C chain
VAFDATDSGATNLGPTNVDLIAEVAARAEAFRVAHGVSVVPIDAVTASASGLDPHISLQNARLQAGRVAEARGVELREVLALVNAAVEGPWLGLFGQSRINVLMLNLSLDDALPLPPSDPQAANG